ncbi:MAG TPA: D-glucuronyl C5-epimerase family protein [Solirubrobacteraceae bacterium]|nr:D-glucuronyl C5-epimerase family protein [Solirubrobacteraceae bacterium]
MLASLRDSGAITPAAYSADLGAYTAAKRSLGRLSGTRRTELGAVLGNLQSIAAAGRLDASRLPVLILTLERNRRWWTTEPLLRDGERVSFPPSEIVWQYYAGQGLEIQWLGTFGEANGYYLSGHENSNLKRLLAEVVPLASARAGGIAWEYMFRFDGGRPPWTSGLSQGTAVQVLARAAARFHEPALLAAAKQALGIFQAPPPVGVRVRTHLGAYYAQYTYAPADRILNGFIQADVGLYDYASISKDPLGLTLFDAGDAQARAMVPHYDTGAWSLYDQFEESSLSYHELLTEFLKHLCQRTRTGPPFVESPQGVTTTPATTTPTTPTTPATGGTSATGSGTTAAPPASERAGPIAGDQVYCATAQRFEEDLTTPPAVSLLSTRLPTGARAGVRVSLSKISTVHLIVRHGGRVIWTNSATVSRGTPRLLWVTPAKPGAYEITLSARDLAGNFRTAHGTVGLARGARGN